MNNETEQPQNRHPVNDLREEYKEHAGQRKRKLDYHKDYNETHKQALADQKRNKYQTDPEFRAAVKKRAKERYETQKKLRQEILKATGIRATPARQRRAKSYLYCPTCLQVIPPAPKPVYKSVQKKYLVAMYPVRELGRRLGKQIQTVVKWIRIDKILPETLYKEQRSGSEPARLWTQDQVEMLMNAFDKYDLRPPVSYHAIGLVKDIRTGWDKLRPYGIDVSKYTIKDPETGLLMRESYELPLPKFATPAEQKDRLKALKENHDEQD